LSGAPRQETTDSGSGSSVCLVGQALLRVQWDIATANGHRQPLEEARDKEYLSY